MQMSERAYPTGWQLLLSGCACSPLLLLLFAIDFNALSDTAANVAIIGFTIVVFLVMLLLAQKMKKERLRVLGLVGIVVTGAVFSAIVVGVF